MSETPVQIVVEPPLPVVVVTVDSPAEVVVSPEPLLPTVEVVVSDVGLPGPPGPDGNPGDDAEIELAMLDHISDETPHPAYDDGPSWVLLYENRKV